MHTTLDGFVARPNGEMDWIKFDDAMFDHVGTLTDAADAALYGRKTWEMMESYWPTAGDKPNATKHDKEHSRWYNSVTKIVISRTLKGKHPDTTIVVSENVADKVRNLKQQAGRNILVFGSPTAGHTLMQHELIDEYWLFVNPVILGKGIPLFAGIKEKTDLEPGPVKEFTCGVKCLSYFKK